MFVCVLDYGPGECCGCRYKMVGHYEVSHVSHVTEGMVVFTWDQTGLNTSTIVHVFCYDSKELER